MTANELKAFRLHECDNPMLLNVYDNGEIKPYRAVVKKQDYRVFVSLGYGMIVKSTDGFSAIITDSNSDCGYAISGGMHSIKHVQIDNDRKKKCSGEGYMRAKNILWKIERVDDFYKKVYLVPYEMEFAVGYNDYEVGRLQPNGPVGDYRLSILGYLSLAFSIGLFCGSSSPNLLVGGIIAPVVVFCATCFVCLFICGKIPILTSRVKTRDENENKEWFGDGLTALIGISMLIALVLAIVTFDKLYLDARW
jgi:hypothetical protein